MITAKDVFDALEESQVDEADTKITKADLESVASDMGSLKKKYGQKAVGNLLSAFEALAMSMAMGDERLVKVNSSPFEKMFKDFQKHM